MNWYFWILRHLLMREKHVVDMVRKVAESVFIPFTVGGGIRTVDDFKALLREGADKISINSSAINESAADQLMRQISLEASVW